MGWYKWLLALLLGLFVYFGISSLLQNIVVGTTVTDGVVRNIVPLIVGLIVFAIPVFAITK